MCGVGVTFCRRVPLPMTSPDVAWYRFHEFPFTLTAASRVDNSAAQRDDFLTESADGVFGCAGVVAADEHYHPVDAHLIQFRYLVSHPVAVPAVPDVEQGPVAADDDFDRPCIPSMCDGRCA